MYAYGIQGLEQSFSHSDHEDMVSFINVHFITCICYLKKKKLTNVHMHFMLNSV